MIKPILFSTLMVQAIMEDRKTQTRRIVKKKYSNTDIEWKEDKYGKRLVERQNDLPDPVVNPDGSITHRLRAYAEINPKYKKGDILWVRETFWFDPIQQVYEYKADEDSYMKLFTGWKPPIHMPKQAARIFLEVTNVRAERLQDISQQDAIAEGIEDFLLHADVGSTAYRNYMVTKKDLEIDHWSHVANDAIESFKTLWESINGIESWEYNPFVWVYEFKKVAKPINFI